MPDSGPQIFNDDSFKKATTNHTGTRRWAQLIILLLFLSILRNSIVCAQIKYQLTSPLIPRDVVYLIYKPFLRCAIGLAAIFVVNLILMYRASFRLAIVLGAVALLAQSVYQAAAQYGLLD